MILILFPHSFSISFLQKIPPKLRITERRGRSAARIVSWNLAYATRFPAGFPFGNSRFPARQPLKNKGKSTQ